MTEREALELSGEALRTALLAVTGATDLASMLKWVSENAYGPKLSFREERWESQVGMIWATGVTPEDAVARAIVAGRCDEVSQPAVLSPGAIGIGRDNTWAIEVLNARRHRERADWQAFNGGVGYDGAIVLRFEEARIIAYSYELAGDTDYRAAVEWLESKISERSC